MAGYSPGFSPGGGGGHYNPYYYTNLSSASAEYSVAAAAVSDAVGSDAAALYPYHEDSSASGMDVHYHDDYNFMVAGQNTPDTLGRAIDAAGLISRSEEYCPTSTTDSVYSNL